MNERQIELRRQSGIFRLAALHIQDYMDLVDRLLDEEQIPPQPRPRKANS